MLEVRETLHGAKLWWHRPRSAEHLWAKQNQNLLRETVPASPGSPHWEWNRAGSTLKILSPAFHVFNFPMHIFFQKTKCSPRDPRFPDCLGTGPTGSLPPRCPSGREACAAPERERWAGPEPRRLPKLGTCCPCGAGSSQAAVRLWEWGSPVPLEPWGWGVGSRGSQTWWPPTLGAAKELSSSWAGQLGRQVVPNPA